MTKRIFLAGGFGKMGLAIQNQLDQEADLELVGILAHSNQTSDVTVPVFTALDDINVTADIWVDVTIPDVAFENGQYALEHGFDLIVGTSGLADEAIEQLKHIAVKNNRHALIVPNFSLSAVLLMQFAEQAAKYFPDVEILEIHNAKKRDSPSGTAKSTASRIAAVRLAEPEAIWYDNQSARGSKIDNVPVHAMRLPGYVAEEEVIFGAPGETLRLKQTSFSRDSFMGGVIQAIEHVAEIDGLVVGLEHVL